MTSRPYTTGIAPGLLRTASLLAPASLCLLFSSAASADLKLPPRVTQVNAAGTALAHAGYLDATLYDGLSGNRVDPSGIADSTAGIQQAINDALTYAMVAYLPPGTYLVSDTLLGQAEDASGHNISCLNHVNYGTPFSAPQSPSLVGPASGPRPTLKLADASAGFGDATSPKPVVHFLLSDANVSGGQGDAACLMWAVLRDVNLSLGSGNTGAVGVEFGAAQYSYIENVSVVATGAYAGFLGIPSTNVVVNVAVDGGQYGIVPTTCCGISLVGVSLKNQTVAALSLANFGATMVTGFDIQQPSGTAIINTFFASQTSEVALVDGNISVGAGAAAAIDNSLGHDLYASNVVVSSPGSIVQSGSQPAVASSGGVDVISEYSYTNTQPYTQSGETQHSYNVVDGVKGQSEIVRVAHGAARPTDLVSRHLPGALPWFADPGVLDATTLGADPTGAMDSTMAIQQALDTSDYVFLPRGDYIVSKTLQLRSSTHLFGVPGVRSRIHGAATWDPGGQYMPLIQTADTVSGPTYVGDIELDLPDTSDAQTYLSAIVWTAGRNSMTRQLAVVLPWTNNLWTTYDRKLVHVEGNGGGRWYGLQLSLEVPARTISATGGFRSLLVEGTTAPLTLYGPNPEHARTEPQFEFSHVSNTRVLGIKTEATLVASFESSNNVMFAAHSGHDGIGAGAVNLRLSDSTNVTFASNQIFSGMGSSSSGSIVEELIDGGTTTSVPGNDQCSLLVRGTFDPAAFPHCGDGACDPTETASSCPSDCHPDAGATPADAGASADSGARAPARGDAGTLRGPVMLDASGVVVTNGESPANEGASCTCAVPGGAGRFDGTAAALLGVALGASVWGRRRGSKR